jgi:hypothetical protein
MTDTPQDPGPAMPADDDKTSNEKLREGMRKVADEVDKSVENLKPRVEKGAADLWGRLRRKPPKSS